MINFVPYRSFDSSRKKTVIHNVHQNIVKDFPDIGATEQKKKTASYTGITVILLKTKIL
jgi:hypothetical protein